MTAYLNIGSNLGRRHELIARAVSALERALGVRATVSDPVESEPWGFSSPNRFLNVGVAVDTELPPLELLRLTRRVERELSHHPHRNPDGSYADRDLDIDIIAVDSLVVQTDELTLPHPRMHLRPFVLRPLAQLAPGWLHPLTGLTPSQMLTRLEAGFGDLAGNG